MQEGTRYGASMKRMRAQLNKREAKKHDRPGRLADRLLEADHNFLAEDAFTSTLRLEGKRTERSGTPFLLMLLTVEEIVGSREREALLFDTASSLFTAVREVDIKGWYRHDVVIGIIFTEINEIGEQVIGKVLAKVHGALCNRIGVELANKVGISVHVFANPAVRNARQRGGSFDPNVYTDLSPGL